jgi:hypothetical protein
MMEAYELTRKDGAPGIDGVTAADYEANLEANLLDLLERIKSGRYHAPPVRRAYIPKADGSLDAPRIMHLMQFAFKMTGEDGRSLQPIFAGADRHRH